MNFIKKNTNHENNSPILETFSLPRSDVLILVFKKILNKVFKFNGSNYLKKIEFHSKNNSSIVVNNVNSKLKWQKYFSGIFGLVLVINLAIYSIVGFFNLHSFTTPYLYPSSNNSSNIVVVSINDESLKEYGKWPWKRDFQAKILDKILENKPKKLGLDVLYSDINANNEADEKLLKILQNDKVISASQLNFKSTGVLYENKNNLTTGFIEFNIDNHSFVRKAITKMGSNQSLAKLLTNKNETPESFLINPQTARPAVISVKDLMTDDSIGKILKDKYVLFGTSALSLNDFHNLPGIGQIPGVDIHGLVAQQILDKQYWQEVKIDTLVFVVLVILIALLLQFILVSKGIKYFKKFISLFNLGILVTFLVLILNHVIFDLNSLVSVISTNSILPVSLWVWNLSDERENIKKALSLYISDKVMNKIMENPKKINLGGQKYNISIMFTDIRGFTTLSESNDNVHEVANILNQVLTIQTDFVLKNDGVIDKYIGDAVMAFWGAPIQCSNHAYSSILTACQVQDEITIYNQNNNKNMRIGIGINTGHCLVGNFGSPKRVEYTAIGDTVNTASRIESITKIYDSSILISEHTLNELNESERSEFWIEELDTIKLKGKNNSIKLYEVLGFSKNKEKSENQKLLTQIQKYQECLNLYYNGQFNEAIEIANQIDLKRAHQLIERCELLKKDIDIVDWDGVWVFDHK